MNICKYTSRMNLQDTHTHTHTCGHGSLHLISFVWISVAKAHHLVRWSINKNLMLSLILPKSKKVKRKATPLLPEKLYRNHRTLKIKREFDEPPLSNPNNRVALETRHWLTIEDAFTASGCVLLCYELAAGYAEPQGRGEK